MKNIFNRSKDSQEQIKERFDKYLLSKNITIEFYNNHFDFFPFLIEVCGNKNINNLKAMKETGFSFENIKLKDIHNALLKSAKHKNFREYFEIILSLVDINKLLQAEKSTSSMMPPCCLLSYLMIKNKHEHIKCLLDNGYPDVFQSPHNMVSHLLKQKKFTEASYLINKGDVQLLPEHIETALHYVSLDNESDKKEFFIFIKDLLSQPKMAESYNIDQAIWTNLLLNPLVSLEEIKQNVPAFQLFKGVPNIWNQLLGLHLTFKCKSNKYFDFNAAINKDYPAKLNFFKEVYSEDNYQELLKGFTKYVLLNPVNKENILYDLEKTGHVKNELLNIKEEIQHKVRYGALNSYIIYTRHHKDEEFVDECIDSFVLNNVVSKYYDDKGDIQDRVDDKLIVNMTNAFTTPETVNKNFESKLDLDEFSNYKFSLFGLLLDYGNKKIIEKFTKSENFDLITNIEIYITNKMMSHLILKNTGAAEGKKEIHEKLKIINTLKGYKDLKIDYIFSDKINSTSDLSLAIACLKADFESVQIIKDVVKNRRTNKHTIKRKRL